MFTEAIARAGKFTIPVVISSRTVAGKCRCEIGAGVVVNPAGWVLTAAHVLALIRSQQEAVQAFRARPAPAPDAAPKPVRKAGWLARRRSRKRSAQEEAPHPDVVRDHSVWWGTDGATLHDVTLDAANDLAVGRLQPFDPRQISYYPVFKRPDADYRPGRSLCRLGFSFHDIVPTYDEARQAFLLPADSVPLPLFPFEGMLVRILRCPSPTAESGELGTFIETSTPGLRGQSGGPIFDVNGTIWALQSHTRHYPLDFKPRPHQFLNVGVGAHAEGDPPPARPAGPGVSARPLTPARALAHTCAVHVMSQLTLSSAGCSTARRFSMPSFSGVSRYPIPVAIVVDVALPRARIRELSD